MVEATASQPAAAPSAETPPQRFLACKSFIKRTWDLICEHWFILGLGFAIGFAAAVPDFGRKGGWIAAQWTIKYGAVIIIFFMSGLSLKTRALLNAIARLHVHIFVQFACLVLTPAIGYGVARALMKSSMQPDLVNGLVVAMCMPTTVSTNVVFTKQAGGNDAIALVNAVTGNIIGIFVSPGWLYLYLGKSGQAPYADVIEQLAVTIIAPLIVGQIVQYIFPTYVKKAQDMVNFGKIGNLMIILLVWSAFCDTFHRDIHLSANSWVPMLFLEIGLFLFFSSLCLALATAVPLKRVFGFNKSDAVAVVMCGSTKTLALGMPLITVMYGKNANVGIISLPLIIYHASQCLLGSTYIKPLKRWVDGASPGAWPASCWPAAEGAAAAVEGSGSEEPSAGKGLEGCGGAASPGSGSKVASKGKGAAGPASPMSSEPGGMVPSCSGSSDEALAAMGTAEDPEGPTVAAVAAAAAAAGGMPVLQASAPSAAKPSSSSPRSGGACAGELVLTVTDDSPDVMGTASAAPAASSAAATIGVGSSHWPAAAGADIERGE